MDCSFTVDTVLRAVYYSVYGRLCLACRMKPYSQDLRERVVSACAQPGRTIAQVAAAFSVSTSFVDKLLRRQRTTGLVAARPHTGGPSPKLDATAQAQLVAWVGQRPDSTLAELQAGLEASGGPAGGPPVN